MRPTTLFGRVLAFVFSLLVLAAAFFFSLVFFAIIYASQFLVEPQRAFTYSGGIVRQQCACKDA